MNTKLLAGMIWLSTQKKSPVTGPSGEPWVYLQNAESQTKL